MLGCIMVGKVVLSCWKHVTRKLALLKMIVTRLMKVQPISSLKQSALPELDACPELQVTECWRKKSSCIV